MKRLARLRRCAITTGTILAQLALAQVALPPVPQGTVTDISTSNGNFTEPSVALNPKNPAQLVVVYQGGNTAQGQGAAVFSNDAGAHFTMAKGTSLPDWHVVGDVTATFDNQGNAFWCYIAFDRLGTPNYWAHDVSRNGVFVRRSIDGGKTWGRAVAVKAFPVGTEPGIGFEDEPRIFADASLAGASPFAGNLYVGWVEWQIDRSVMLFSRSTDAGQSWSAPVRIDRHAGLPRDDNGALGGFTQTLAPDGTICAVWADGNSIILTESRDGGVTFSQPTPIIETAPPYFQVPGVARSDGFPQIAWGRDAEHHEGRLYVSWSDYRNGDVDVFLSSSDDGGRSWSPALRVNDDPIHNGVDQFFQWMTVDPVTQAIYLVFYDRRLDSKNYKLTITLARSVDGGRSFRNYAWTQSPWDGQNAFLGDYTSITAYDNRVYAAWTETVINDRQTSGKGARTYPATRVRMGTAHFSH